MIKIFKGDDTGGTLGKRVEVEIVSDLPLDGCVIVFSFCGVVREFTGVASGDKLEIFFSHNDTQMMPIGIGNATIKARDAAGKIRTLTNSLPIKVSTNLAECYGDNMATVVIAEAIPWSRITDKPTTLEGYGIGDAASSEALSEVAEAVSELGRSVVKTVNGQEPDENGDVEVETGGGGTTDYNDLSNKPSINGVTLSGNKTAEDLGLATLEEFSELAGEVVAKYTKPQTGIPASDMTPAVQESLGKADNSVQKTGAAAEAGQTIEGKLQIDSDTGIRVYSPFYEYWIEFGSTGTTGSGNEIFSIVINIGGTFYYLSLPQKSGTLALLSDLANLRSKPDLTVYAYESWIDSNGSIYEYDSSTGEWGYSEMSRYSAIYFTGDSWTYRVSEGGTETYYTAFGTEDDLTVTFADLGMTFTRSAVYDTSDTIAKVSQLPNLSVYAPLYSPAFTGAPTAPTPDAADNSTNVATTAFVKTAISGISVTPLSGRNFDFATTQGVMDALKATIEALGGTVTNAPTTPVQNNQAQGE